MFGRCRRRSGYDYLLGVCISSSRQDVHVRFSHAPASACAGHDSRSIDNRRGRHTYKGLRTKGKENAEKVTTVCKDVCDFGVHSLGVGGRDGGGRACT